MTFKELKPKVLGESLTIFMVYPDYELLKKKNFKVYNAEDETDYDDYKVGIISDIGDSHIIYLMGK